jgi:hypothetical protein
MNPHGSVLSLVHPAGKHTLSKKTKIYALSSVAFNSGFSAPKEKKPKL